MPVDGFTLVNCLRARLIQLQCLKVSWNASTCREFVCDVERWVHLAKNMWYCSHSIFAGWTFGYYCQIDARAL